MKQLMIAGAMLASLISTTAAAPYDTKRLDQIPDFTQTDPALKLPNGGRMYCVPVATANVLVWLAEHRGFKRLLPVRGLGTTEKVAEVARALGSRKFMSTAPKGGTSHVRFLQGLDAYVGQSGYRARIHYRGRWQVPSKYSRGSNTPALTWIKNRFDAGGAVWLSIGYYQTDSTGRELKRLGGHMVTVVGHGVDQRGRANRDVLILHDSDDGYSRKIRRQHLQFERMRQGWFMTRSGARGPEVRDHLMVTDGIRLRRNVRAVVDAAIALDL